MMKLTYFFKKRHQSKGQCCFLQVLLWFLDAPKKSKFVGCSCLKKFDFGTCQNIQLVHK
jgi:hypothetical protein